MAGYFNPYPGCYFSGDGAYRDKDGHYRITGRVDDVINVKSHRLGTAEVESAMVRGSTGPFQEMVEGVVHWLQQGSVCR